MYTLLCFFADLQRHPLVSIADLYRLPQFVSKLRLRPIHKRRRIHSPTISATSSQKVKQSWFLLHSYTVKIVDVDFMTSSEVNDLFEQTLKADYDDEAPWAAVTLLRRNENLT
jgi:hypothetical protein